jgi:hypothetical protein
MTKFLTPALQSKWLIYTTPLVLYSIVFMNGALGINFGSHWDEYVMINWMNKTFVSGKLLPQSYQYPSFCYYILLLVGWVYSVFFDFGTTVPWLNEYSFYLVARFVFLFISCFTVIWVYIVSFKIAQNYVFALIAGLIFSSSFEFSYHARWAVTDMVAVQFAFLSTMLLFLNISLRKKIILCSIIAGLACGTKYTAGIVLLNILIYIFSVTKRKDFYKTAQLIVLATFLFLVAFVLSTPGSLIEPAKFWGAMKFQSNIYSNPFFGYTVRPGGIHFSKIIIYLLCCLFSRVTIISIILTVFLFCGICFALMRKDINILALFIVMLLYLIYVSQHTVMVVRNLLYVLPYFSVLASLGFMFLLKNIRNRTLAIFFSGLFFTVLLFSNSVVSQAALTIHAASIVPTVPPKNIIKYGPNNDYKDSQDLKSDLVKFLTTQLDDRFLFSPRVAELLSRQNSVKATESAYIVFFKNEVNVEYFQANKFRLYKKVIGVQDVNFDYYPTWCGVDRIIIMRYADAHKSILRAIGLVKQPEKPASE